MCSKQTRKFKILELPNRGVEKQNVLNNIIEIGI